MITVDGLTKHFATANGRVVAVDSLSFQVHSGEVYGLLGPNGAGKTTTLRMILGLLPPTAGYAELNGQRTSGNADDVKRQIGFVSAESGVYQWLTAREMLLYFADEYGTTAEVAASRIEQLADLLVFREYLDRRCTNLSTGQKQRLILARGLVHDPQVMLLDEPTRGLDIVGSQVVFDYVQHLREQQKAVIISTHRLDEAQRVCDRFGLMYRGRLIHEGTLAQLQAATGQPTLVDMFLQFVEIPSRIEELAP